MPYINQKSEMPVVAGRAATHGGMNANLMVVQTDSVVISLTRASVALTEALTIQQTKKIVDMAAAAEIYARRQKLGVEISDRATSVKSDALRKLGEMLKAAPKRGTAHSKGGGSKGSKREPLPDAPPTLDDLGLTKKESAVAQKLATLSEKAFEEVQAGHITIAKAIAAVNASNPVKPEKPAKKGKQRATQEGEPDTPADADALKEAELTVSELLAENDQLKDRLAVEAMDASEEEKLLASATIAELRAELDTAQVMLRVITLSRDHYMQENAELKRQCMAQQREIKKLRAP